MGWKIKEFNPKITDKSFNICKQRASETLLEYGESISEKSKKEKWGTSVVEQLSKDLKSMFPNQQGFSRSNLFSMKKWYEFYSSSNVQIEKIQQLVGQTDLTIVH